jgi:hypothetical protein
MNPTERKTRTKDECLRAAAHALVVAVIRIEQERLDAGLPPHYRNQTDDPSGLP